MNVVIINKSDSTGGAAIVSRRLMEALRQQGVEADMLVCEKLSDSPFVELAASKLRIKWSFYLERLKLVVSLRFKRKNLFKIDAGDYGLPLWKHPKVKEADAILLNWVNQGMLSLKGFRKILKLDKPVIWTMHDMWNMTGICHYSHDCFRFINSCGDCPLLNDKSMHDLSYKILNKKKGIYGKASLMKKCRFIAVSHWLQREAFKSSAMASLGVEVIPNAFQPCPVEPQTKDKNKIRLIFGAARLDDPIKGLDTFIEVSKILKKYHPDVANRLEIILFGNIKDEKLLDKFALPVIKMGSLLGDTTVAKIYNLADILISTASYENLPGTLVEAQAYGCIPVSFLRGGQDDIIRHLSTGYLAEYDDNLIKRATNIANGIIWALNIIKDPLLHSAIQHRMLESVEEKFSYETVANKYITLIQQLRNSH